MNHDDWINYYTKENGLSADQIDDVLNHAAYHFRRAASLNERALLRTPYDQLAKEAGYDNVWDYMKSPHNPKMTQYLRVSSNSPGADGAAACIVVPTEIAKQFNAKPIEVLGVGASVLDSMVPHLEKKATAEASTPGL